MYDFFVFSLNVEAGQEQPELPGFLISQAPRKAVRNRAGDLLIGLVSLGAVAANTTGAAVSRPPLSARIDSNQLLDDLAQTYFSTPGPVTAGMRAAADELNDALLDLNLQHAREGWQAVALLNLAVLHNDLLFLAHCGPTHTYLLSRTQVTDHYEPQLGGRGLGISRTAALRFFQSEVQAGDLLVFSPAPPASWTVNSLAGSPGLSFEALRRRLLNQAGQNLRAAVVQLQNGKGLVHRLRPRPTAMAADKPIPPSERPAAPLADKPLAEPEGASAPPVIEIPAPAVIPPMTTAPADFLPPDAIPLPPSAVGPTPASTPRVEQKPISAPAEPPVKKPIPAPVPIPERIHTPASVRAAVAPVSKTAAAATGAKAASAARQTRSETKAVLRKALLSINAFQARAKSNLSTFLARLAPGLRDRVPALPPKALLFIALAVPVMVVAVAMAVYIRNGYAEQRQVYLAQAGQQAALAGEQTDPIVQRSHWQQVLQLASQAEHYGPTDETAALAQQARQKIDEIDGIARLDFHPATQGGFASGVRITQMAATSTDVYMLDTSQNRVLRMFLTGQGYEYDPNFNCASGEAGKLVIGPLVDLVALPANSIHKATVAVIDNTGNLMYCIPGSAPVSVQLPLPDAHWGQIVAVTLDQGSLYVLDPQNNMVYRYNGQYASYENQPRLFFGNEVPRLDDVNDLAVNGDELYLLHSSGQITTCTFRGYGEDYPTLCEDPTPYGDSRAGHEANPMTFQGARFVQLQATLPPDPSLYILDDSGKAIYHFSLRLNLQRELRASLNADIPLPGGSATGFVVTPNQVAVLAVENQVYTAQIP